MTGACGGSLGSAAVSAAALPWEPCSGSDGENKPFRTLPGPACMLPDAGRGRGERRGVMRAGGFPAPLLSLAVSRERGVSRDARTGFSADALPSPDLGEDRFALPSALSPLSFATLARPPAVPALLLCMTVGEGALTARGRGGSFTCTSFCTYPYTLGGRMSSRCTAGVRTAVTPAEGFFLPSFVSPSSWDSERGRLCPGPPAARCRSAWCSTSFKALSFASSAACSVTFEAREATMAARRARRASRVLGPVGSADGRGADGPREAGRGAAAIAAPVPYGARFAALFPLRLPECARSAVPSRGRGVGRATRAGVSGYAFGCARPGSRLGTREACATGCSSSVCSV